MVSLACFQTHLILSHKIHSFIIYSLDVQPFHETLITLRTATDFHHFTITKPQQRRVYLPGIGQVRWSRNVSGFRSVAFPVSLPFAGIKSVELSSKDSSVFLIEYEMVTRIATTKIALELIY